MPKKHLFRLYVANMVTSKAAIEKLHHCISRVVGDNYELEVLNVVENLSQAVQDGVLVTPTLLMLLVAPSAKLTGDYTDRVKVEDFIRKNI